MVEVASASDGRTLVTLMIILGGVAALYLIWLLFRLAAFALPVYSAVGAGLFVHTQGYGTSAMLLVGFTTGLIVYLTGQAVFVSVRSPLLRFLVALLFAVPAGFAGYQAMTGLLGLMIEDGIWTSCLAIFAGLATASAAWRSLAGAAPASGLSGPDPQSKELNPSTPQV